MRCSRCGASNEQPADRRSALRRHALRALAAGFVVLAGLPRTSAAPEDDYPAQPVHLIVSFPAGTAVDTLGRIVGTKLATALVNRHRSKSSRRRGKHRHDARRACSARRVHPCSRRRRSDDQRNALRHARRRSRDRLRPVIQLTTQPIVLNPVPPVLKSLRGTASSRRREHRRRSSTGCNASSRSSCATRT